MARSDLKRLTDIEAGIIMSASNAARKIDLPNADDLHESPGLKAAEDFINSRALEILREWATSPEIEEIMVEAKQIKAAEAARER